MGVEQRPRRGLCVDNVTDMRLVRGGEGDTEACNTIAGAGTGTVVSGGGSRRSGDTCTRSDTSRSDSTCRGPPGEKGDCGPSSFSGDCSVAMGEEAGNEDKARTGLPMDGNRGRPVRAAEVT